MNETDKQTFKTLFSDYCRSQINAGRCSEDDCEFCPVDDAYEKIFNGAGSDGEEDEEDE